MTAPERARDRAPVRNPATDASGRGPGPGQAPAPASHRPPLAAAGVAAAVVALLLGLAAAAGAVALGVALLVLQVLLAVGVLVSARAPALPGTAALVALVAAAADAAVLRAGRVDVLVGATALSFVAVLLLQLARWERDRVAEALADALLAVCLAVGAACLAALHAARGPEPLLLVLAVTGAAVLAGRVADGATRGPRVAAAPTRTWAGAGVALAAGALVAAVAAVVADLPPGRSALVGLAVAAAAAVGDLAVAACAAALRGVPGAARRTAALRPVAVLLPYAVAGPVGLALGGVLA